MKGFDWQGRLAIGLLTARIVLYTAALYVFGTGAIIALAAIRPFSLVLNLVLFDVVCSRFIAAENALEESHLEVEFPGRRTAERIVTGWRQLTFRRGKDADELEAGI